MKKVSVENLRENPFRDEIFDYLLDHGYFESKKTDYDYKNAIDRAKLFKFLEDSQPGELAKLKKTYGNSYKEKYIELLCRKIDNRGLLRTLTEWIEDYASNTKFSPVFFKTGIESMSDNIALYKKNVFSVRREFSYEDKENSFRVDLAIFLNGIPIVMIELKKQTAGQKAGFEGTRQFKETRDPDQLCFSFNKRTLIYFAIDELVAFMTTRLDRSKTKFLPFNKGDNESAGNPIVYGKHSTHYLWEEILQKNMLLRIIREFMFVDDEGNMIFPRYHQLRAVLHIEDDVKNTGIGGRYLIWHSAGSGKTKTIAWLSKRLINIQGINTVIVISDRTVIDGQLGSELMTMDGRKGVAQHIDTTSKDLLKRLKDGGYIIVTTLQKFRPILNDIKQYKDRKYAIIIDEAHSSTSGKSLSKASETLTGKSLKEAVEIDNAYEELEDGQNQLLNSEVIIKSTNNVSYFAFTATPKKETVELFGTRREQGKTYFDKYSMKQAIEEKYILNPLQAYTKYQEHYKVAALKDDGEEYEAGKSQRAIFNYITTSEDVLNYKTKIIADDFLDNRITWLKGKAKAMVITPSRKHAVCYKIAIDEYLKNRNSNILTCVAFTGTIELEGAKFTEEAMNKKFKENRIPYDLKSIIANNDDLRIIVVADKLQTGFDEDKLCILYIDKKLGSSVKAVQTISRINRPKKDKRTFIMDFVNDIDEIIRYFTEFYGGEIYLPRENETDPNVLFIKRDKILDYHVVTENQIDKIYENILSEKSRSGDLTNIVVDISKSYNDLEDKDKKLFLLELNKFSKLFYYISAVYNTWNDDMKKLAMVFDVLYKVLYEKGESKIVNPEELVELIDFSAHMAKENISVLLKTTDLALNRIPTDVVVNPKTFSLITDIVEKFNLKYANADKELDKMVDDLSTDDSLVVNVRDSTPGAYESAVMDRVSSKITAGLLAGTIDGDAEKSAFYTELSGNKVIISQITEAVIKKIKDLLVAG